MNNTETRQDRFYRLSAADSEAQSNTAISQSPIFEVLFDLYSKHGQSDWFYAFRVLAGLAMMPKKMQQATLDNLNVFEVGGQCRTTMRVRRYS